MESRNQAIARVDLHRQAKSGQVDQIDQSRSNDEAREQQWPVFTYCHQIPSLVLPLFSSCSRSETFYIRALLNKQAAKSRDSLPAQLSSV